jgi:hypothetical protein
MPVKTKKVTFYLAGGFTILLLIAILIPNLVATRFTLHEFFTIRIQVTDKSSGKAVPEAEVLICGKNVDITKLSLRGPVTDTNGMCEFLYGLEATGITGHSGQFHIPSSLLVVRASGFQVWERPLDAVFGSSRDYYKDSRELSYAVKLER